MASKREQLMAANSRNRMVEQDNTTTLIDAIVKEQSQDSSKEQISNMDNTANNFESKSNILQNNADSTLNFKELLAHANTVEDTSKSITQPVSLTQNLKDETDIIIKLTSTAGIALDGCNGKNTLSSVVRAALRMYVDECYKKFPGLEACVKEEMAKVK